MHGLLRHIEWIHKYIENTADRGLPRTLRNPNSSCQEVKIVDTKRSNSDLRRYVGGIVVKSLKTGNKTKFPLKLSKQRLSSVVYTIQVNSEIFGNFCDFRQLLKFSATFDFFSNYFLFFSRHLLAFERKVS